MEVSAGVVALPDWNVRVLRAETPLRLAVFTNQVPAAFGNITVVAPVSVPVNTINPDVY